MERRKIGRSALESSTIVFGGNVLGWTVDQAQGFRILDAFVDAGFNAIDTADTYSRWVAGNKGGESETIIGNWLKQGGGRRERVLIFTKLGAEMGPDRKGLSRRYIKAEVEESLRRLQTDTIDLYQSHRDDTATPMLETLETYAELIREGKVRAIGASNFSAARLQEALDVSAKHGLPRYECLQPRFNLYDRADYEGALEQLCRKEKIGVIPYYGLASGFLSGKYRSVADFGKSPRGGAMANYLNAKGLKLLAHRADCERHQRRAAQGFLRRGGTEAVARGDRKTGCRRRAIDAFKRAMTRRDICSKVCFEIGSRDRLLISARRTSRLPDKPDQIDPLWRGADTANNKCPRMIWMLRSIAASNFQLAAALPRSCAAGNKGQRKIRLHAPRRATIPGQAGNAARIRSAR